jgi:hypothetical protein
VISILEKRLNLKFTGTLILAWYKIDVRVSFLLFIGVLLL